MFQKDAPILSYCQKTLNSYCFSSLASAFASNKHFKAANSVSICIKESLKSEVANLIDFANEIMLNPKRNKGEARVYYILIKYKKIGDYKSLEDISANFTLVQLMDSIGNVNHAISVVGSWIFDSNYERALVLNKASLDMICAPSIVEEQAAKFENFYYAVRYIFNEENWRKDSSYISPQTQSGSFLLPYERLKVMMWICLPIHIQSTNFNPKNDEIKLLWYK